MKVYERLVYSAGLLSLCRGRGVELVENKTWAAMQSSREFRTVERWPRLSTTLAERPNLLTTVTNSFISAAH